MHRPRTYGAGRARFGIGHSMAIDPMGRVVKELDERVGSFVTTVDAETVERAHQEVPVLASRKLRAMVPD